MTYYTYNFCNPFHMIGWIVVLGHLFSLTNPLTPHPKDRNQGLEDDEEIRYFKKIEEPNVKPSLSIPRIETGGERSRTVTNDPSTIMFPHDLSPIGRSNLTTSLGCNGRRSKKIIIPLKFLLGLSNEREVSKIFEKYVTNVKLQDVNNGEKKYVVDLRGDPIDAGLGGPVIVESDSEQTTEKPKKFGGFSNRLKQQSIMTTMATERFGISIRTSKPAICEPELRTVEIPAQNDPSIIYFPRCVRLERCGGCCGSDLLSCEPVRTKQIEVQFQKFAYNDETDKLEYRETEVMILPCHVECRCTCRIKSSDCSPRQIYSGEDCFCSCRNRGEEELCLEKAHKLWDTGLCQCICHEIKVCSSGYTFNNETCECVLNPEERDLEAQSGSRNRREHVRTRPSRL